MDAGDYEDHVVKLVGLMIEDCNSSFSYNNSSQVMAFHTMLQQQDTIFPVTCAIIIIVGLVGNGLTILSVLCNPDMRCGANILIANISVADILFLIFCCMPEAVRYQMWYWPFGKGMCKVMYFFASVTLYMRIYTLLLLSVERLLSLMHPDINRRAMYLIIEGVLWFVLCLNSLFGPIVSVVTQLCYPWERELYEWCVLMGDTFNEFWWGMFTFSFLLPLTGVTVIFVVIIYRYCCGYSLGRTMGEVPDAKSTTVTVLLMSVFCVVCWMPLYSIMLSQTGGADDIRNHIEIFIHMGQRAPIAYIIGYCNMCIYPLLYVTCMPAFRCEYTHLFLLKCRHSVARRTRREQSDMLETSSLNQATIEL